MNPPVGSVLTSPPSETPGIKEALKTFAAAIGFDLCGIAPAVPPPHGDAYRAWLDAEYHGSMEWIARNKERRVAPGVVQPNAQSIIVLGLNYFQKMPTPPDDAQPEGVVGKIARYAWGTDYHDIVLKKLKALDAWLAERGGTQRYYVDTGPVLERDFARLAGLGWQAKSSMLIHPKWGTWLFLAELITTLALEPDQPIRDHCGSCTRCMTACPTQAIVSEKVVDARRCISYLLIENRGPIPMEFREAIGDRIYGCDTCLDVCPWNRFAQEARETDFAARSFVAGKSLRQLLSLTQEEFSALFAKSPIKRIKREGLQRNLCVALGNAGEAEDLPALETVASQGTEMLREHALWAIAKIRQRLATALAPG